MVAEGQVMVVLRPWLGVRLSRTLEPLMGEISRKLNAYSSRQEPDPLAQEIDSLLFFAVRDATMGSMLIQLEDGGWVRMRVEDFATMADELLYLVFAEFPVDSQHLLLLREYSMRRASLAALRVLYTRFRDLQTREELSTSAAVAKSCYPPFRWREWLVEAADKE